MDIKPIDKGSVHRLCSGQVVLTLSTAVKELVENSLDAGAKNISVRIKLSGLELIEVVDDGCGVVEENYQALTLKHFTSKISSFSDLTTVETFGFRGEALSSLCALSNLTIVTRTRESKVATKIVYDHNGKIILTSSCHREPGTTVLIENIFKPLPVRRKELEKNINKEFNKMVTNISGYCLLCEGVKMVLTNQAKNKGSSNTVLKINANKDVKANIIDVFGVKQWSSLKELKMVDADEEVLKEFNIQDTPRHNFIIAGYVSSAEHGKGRSSTDRQFLFINKRPFDCSKLCRLTNEVYHTYNRNQFPFLLLNITTLTSNVDVNVTPDKRQVFMHNEKLLMALVKASLKALYINTPSECPSLSSSSTLKRTLNKNTEDDTAFNTSTSTPLFKKQKTLDDSITFLTPPSSSQNSHEELNSNTSNNNGINNDNNKKENHNNNNDNTNNEVSINGDNNIHALSTSGHFKYDEESYYEGKINEKSKVNPYLEEQTNLQIQLISQQDSSKQQNLQHSQIQLNPHQLQKQQTLDRHKQNLSQKQQNQQQKQNIYPNTEKHKKLQQQPIRPQQHSPNSGYDNDVDVDDDDCVFRSNRRVVDVEFSMQKLREKFLKTETNERVAVNERRFKAEIKTDDNSRAEEELKRSIDKSAFQSMRILGQFNLGFIIAYLPPHNLFIIDQHATDEKYNFEWLEKNVVLQNQKLISPQSLELTACNESVLIENLQVFRLNGFEFCIQSEAPPTQKVQLTSIPTSRNWLFGQQDIEEMIFMLSDAPSTLCRPTRIRQMLASRACRRSVMIGTALKTHEMSKIVRHMADMDQPWNCPHGRPTIRHLIDLNMIHLH